jgi:hypothetical protein
MAVERRLEGKGSGVALCGAGKLVAGLDVVRLRNVDRPNACCVVGAAGCEMAHVWGQEHACDVGVVCDELANGDDGGYFSALDHLPDVDITLVMSVVPEDAI